jgi:hypothetical protein
MRATILFIILLKSLQSPAQFEVGFSKKEARDMIAICNSFTFLELFQSDAEIIPAGYEKMYTSVVYGMDNKYQIYQNGNVAIINIRGSTDKKLSWLENFYSVMIPAKGKISIAEKAHDYCFAKDEKAAVHSGYALGIVILSEDIIQHIDSLNKKGIYNFMITGHSQGGALSHMLRAYLENYPGKKLSKKNEYKTYAFASPMIGNKEFVDEYVARYCINNTSFSIINPNDLVPSFPITYKDGTYVTAEDLQTLLFNYNSFSFSQFAFNVAVNIFEKKIIEKADNLGTSVSKEISKDIGTVVMPQSVQKINYVKMGNVIEIPPAEYPLILKDSTILTNDSLMLIYKRDEKGNFLNKELYKRESMFYQHKAYNYYTSLLKMYFPDEYKELKMKYINDPLWK